MRRSSSLGSDHPFDDLRDRALNEVLEVHDGSFLRRVEGKRARHGARAVHFMGLSAVVLRIRPDNRRFERRRVSGCDKKASLPPGRPQQSLSGLADPPIGVPDSTATAACRAVMRCFSVIVAASSALASIVALVGMPLHASR